MAIDVEIVSQPIRMIMESDGWQILLAVATIAVAVSAWFTLLRTHSTTQKQLKLSRDEFRHKTRPILARHVYQMDLKEPRQYSGDVYSLIPEKALFHFKNTGTTTAINIKVKSNLSMLSQPHHIPSLDPYQKYETDPLPDLAPTEYYSIDIAWNEKYFSEAMNGSTCYFALLIWYHDDNNNEYYYHMEGHFKKSFLFLNYVRTGILNENT